VHGTTRRLRIGLGTLIAIEAAADSPDKAAAAVEAAFAAIREVDEQMRPLSPAGDLARINHAPRNAPVAVHPQVCELLRFARRLHDLTDGVFDPCLPHRPGRLTDITVATDSQLVCRQPVALDFGGFAKGYAVDRAVDVLKAHGCSDGLVNAGGDLRVFGPRRETILLRGPGGELRPVPLADAALAASDVDSQRRPEEHQGYYSRNAEDLMLTNRFAAVIANTACVADALVKCVLLCPEGTTSRVLAEFGARRVN
jgi:FAD:protein FMN transferase